MQKLQMRRTQWVVGPANGRCRTVAWLALGCLALACQPESRPAPPAEKAMPSEELAVAAAAPVPPPVAAAAPVPPPVAAEPEAEKPKPTRLWVVVSEEPPTEPVRELLASYDRRGKGQTPWHVDVHTDRNAAEFPGSVTRVKLGYVADPVAVSGAKARAMKVELTLKNQMTPFAGCDTKRGSATGCGCEKIIPYTYIALVHRLAVSTRLDKSKYLSFWAKSAEPFDLQLALGCYIEPRPDVGYLDAARQHPDPCWLNLRSELKLPDPVQIRGDDQWHRYQVRIDDLPPSEVVEGMSCTLRNVTQISYVLQKGVSPKPGEFPADQGMVVFDDLEAFGTP